MKTKIIIAGSRDFNNFQLGRRVFISLLEALTAQCDISELEIISGCAHGADRVGETLAREFKIKLHKMPAQWDLYGKSAGYKRNEEMAKYAISDSRGVLLAFHDGESRGTQHMINLANKNKLDIVKVVNFKQIGVYR